MFNWKIDFWIEQQLEYMFKKIGQDMLNTAIVASA